MLKKIKNLTEEEMKDICYKCDDCKKCPLDIRNTNECIRCLTMYNALKEKLEQVVEVKRDVKKKKSKERVVENEK